VYHTRRDKMHQKALSCKNTKNKSPRLMSIHILAVDIPLELHSWSLLHHPLVQVAPPSNIYFKILKIDFTNSISYKYSNVVLASIVLQLLLFCPCMSRLRQSPDGPSESNQVLIHMPSWAGHTTSSVLNLTRFHPHDHFYISAILPCKYSCYIIDFSLH